MTTFRLFTVLSLVLVLWSAVATAKDYSEQRALLARQHLAQILPAEAQTAIAELWQRTNIDSYPTIRDAAIRLGLYENEDVSTVLFYRLKIELDREKPNTVVLRALLDGIGTSSDTSWSPDLAVLTARVEAALARVENPGKVRETRDSIGRATASVAARPVVEPAEPAPIRNLPAVIPPPVRPLINGQLPTLRELANAAGQKTLVDVFQKMTITNFYDGAVKKHNAPGATDMNFFGRADEVQKLAEAINRLEKGHVLLSGKAGVGKTTLIRILMDRYIDGTASFPGGKIPLIFEVPITTVVEKQPGTIIATIRAAQNVAEKLGRHVILFADEAHVSSEIVRHGIKANLSQLLREEASLVHWIWATTAKEARELMDDSAFRRRWTDVFVPELSRDQTILAISQVFISQWKNKHNRDGYAFNGEIGDEAFSFAYRNAHLEQRHAGNPTSTKELLEGAIVHKLEELKRTAAPAGEFPLLTEDIQRYLRFQKNIKIIPGDARGAEMFAQLWAE